MADNAPTNGLFPRIKRSPYYGADTKLSLSVSRSSKAEPDKETTLSPSARTNYREIGETKRADKLIHKKTTTVLSTKTDSDSGFSSNRMNNRSFKTASHRVDEKGRNGDDVKSTKNVYRQCACVEKCNGKSNNRNNTSGTSCDVTGNNGRNKNTSIKDSRRNDFMNGTNCDSKSDNDCFNTSIMPSQKIHMNGTDCYNNGSSDRRMRDSCQKNNMNVTNCDAHGDHSNTSTLRDKHRSSEIDRGAGGDGGSAKDISNSDAHARSRIISDTKTKRDQNYNSSNGSNKYDVGDTVVAARMLLQDQKTKPWLKNKAAQEVRDTTSASAAQVIRCCSRGEVVSCLKGRDIPRCEMKTTDTLKQGRRFRKNGAINCAAQTDRLHRNTAVVDNTAPRSKQNTKMQQLQDTILKTSTKISGRADASDKVDDQSKKSTLVSSKDLDRDTSDEEDTNTNRLTFRETNKKNSNMPIDTVLLNTSNKKDVVKLGRFSYGNNLFGRDSDSFKEKVTNVYSVTQSFSDVYQPRRDGKSFMANKKGSSPHQPVVGGVKPSAAAGIDTRRRSSKGLEGKSFKSNRPIKDMYDFLGSNKGMYDPKVAPLLYETMMVEGKITEQAGAKLSTWSHVWKGASGQIVRSSVTSVTGAPRDSVLHRLGHMRSNLFGSHHHMRSSVFGSHHKMMVGGASRYNLAPQRQPIHALSSRKASGASSIATASAKDLNRDMSMRSVVSEERAAARYTSSMKVKITPGKSDSDFGLGYSETNTFDDFTATLERLPLPRDGPAARWLLRQHRMERARRDRLAFTRETGHACSLDVDCMSRLPHAQDTHLAFSGSRIPTLRRSPAHIVWPIRDLVLASGSRVNQRRTSDRKPSDRSLMSVTPSGSLVPTRSNSEILVRKRSYPKGLDLERGTVRIDQESVGGPRFYPWAPFNSRMVTLVRRRVMQESQGGPLPYLSPTPPQRRLAENARLLEVQENTSSETNTAGGRLRRGRSKTMSRTSSGIAKRSSSKGVAAMFEKAVLSSVSSPAYYGIK